MSISVNISGADKEIEKGFVNVNGTWKDIDKVFCNINGAWKEGWMSFAPRVGIELYVSGYQYTRTIETINPSDGNVQAMQTNQSKYLVAIDDENAIVKSDIDYSTVIQIGEYYYAARNAWVGKLDNSLNVISSTNLVGNIDMNGKIGNAYYVTAGNAISSGRYLYKFVDLNQQWRLSIDNLDGVKITDDYIYVFQVDISNTTCRLCKYSNVNGNKIGDVWVKNSLYDILNQDGFVFKSSDNNYLYFHSVYKKQIKLLEPISGVIVTTLTDSLFSEYGVVKVDGEGYVYFVAMSITSPYTCHIKKFKGSTRIYDTSHTNGDNNIVSKLFVKETDNVINKIN